MRSMGMKAVSLTIGSLTVLATLTGCSDSSDGDAAAKATATVTATVTVTETAAPDATQSASATPTAVPPNVGADALHVGEWREGAGVRTLVSELQQPSEVTPPSYLVGEHDAEGALLEVKQCERKTGS